MLDMLKGAGKTNAESLDPTVIRIDGGTQMRAELNPATVAEYTEAWLTGARFPDIVVYYDGLTYWLGDGFHRLESHKRAFGRDPSQPTIGAEVRSGTRRDAILHAAGANASHGLRRTNADKRRAVETLLRDEEWSLWSDREIAKACGVDHKTVGNLRRDLSGEIPQMPTERRVERNGATYTQNTAGIASANQERKTSTVTKAHMVQPQPAPVSKPPEISTVQDLVTETVLRQLHVNLLSARPYIAEAIGQTEKLGHSAWMVQALHLIDMEIKRVEENSAHTR